MSTAKQNYLIVFTIRNMFILEQRPAGQGSKAMIQVINNIDVFGLDRDIGIVVFYKIWCECKKDLSASLVNCTSYCVNFHMLKY